MNNDNDDNTLTRLQRHMELSRIIGAPVGNIPAKAIAVVELITPYLTENTTPREAAIIMGSVYAYFAAMLTRDIDGHQLLDTAITIVGDLCETEED